MTPRTADRLKTTTFTAEREAFDAGHDSMRMGWTGTMDQLDEYLKKVQAC